MFAVHGQESHSFLLRRADEDLARHHQRLLIGKGNLFARSYRRKSRQQPGSTDDGGHDDIDFMGRGNCGRPPFSAKHLHSIAAEQLAETWHVFLILDGDTPGRKFLNLRHEPLEIFSRN